MAQVIGPQKRPRGKYFAKHFLHDTHTPLRAEGGGGFRGGHLCGNHLEERLLDQAQARALYTPIFGGRSRSIPQGMILDVQPLVKSLFCPTKRSPNGFFDSEASIP